MWFLASEDENCSADRRYALSKQRFYVTVWLWTEARWPGTGTHQRCVTCRWPQRRCAAGCHRNKSGRSSEQLPPPGPRSAAVCRESADRCQPRSSWCVWRPRWWSPTPVWTEQEGWRGMQESSGSLQLGVSRKSGSCVLDTLQSSGRKTKQNTKNYLQRFTLKVFWSKLKQS